MVPALYNFKLFLYVIFVISQSVSPYLSLHTLKLTMNIFKLQSKKLYNCRRCLCFKTFYRRYCCCNVLSQSVYFHPTIIFAGKARSLPLEWNLAEGHTQSGKLQLCLKYQTRAEVANTLAYYDMTSITAIKSLQYWYRI